MEIESCPLCNHAVFEHFLTCQDYTASGEQFDLKRCTSCGFILTSPRPDDLAQYYSSPKYISHTGKSAGLLDRIYLFARRFTLSWKINLIRKAKPKADLSILDYGCGTGEFLQMCQKQKWHVSGFEPSGPARKKAMQITGINIAYQQAQLDNLKFDVITLWHVLEHVQDLHDTIKLLKSILKHDGLLLIAVPNHESYDARTYGKFWAAYDVPRHLWHFSRNTMAKLLKSENLTIRKIHPMKLDAYYVSMLSEKYKSNGKATISTAIKGAWHGFNSNRLAIRSAQNSSLIYFVTQ